MSSLDGFAPTPALSASRANRFRSARRDAALRAGIAAVHQSPMLFERFTWEENLALGGFGRDGGGLGLEKIDLQAVTSKARELARHLGFELPPPRAIIAERSVAERVRLEVLRALSFDPRVLILDEPTGVLAPSELTAFLDLLRRLRGEGRIVILITHKLAEARAVADRITVLRNGRVVAETTPAESDESELARLMIGELTTPPEAQLHPVARPTRCSKSKTFPIETTVSRSSTEFLCASTQARSRASLVSMGTGRSSWSKFSRVRAVRPRDRFAFLGNGNRLRDGRHTAGSRPRRAHPRHAALGKSCCSRNRCARG